MLTNAALAVVAALTGGREATVADLASATEYSKPHLYDVVDELLDDGLLEARRGPNNNRSLRLTDHPVADAYRTLAAALPHVEWADLLSPATLRVCWFLDEPHRVSEIASRLQIARQNVHKALAPLKNRAMLSPSGPAYALSEDLKPLHTFARAVIRHGHHSRARAVAPSATIEWCDPLRALIRVQTSADTATLTNDSEWQVTGLARFADYDLQFFLADEPTFWYGPAGTLSPADVVCHTLVRDSGSRRVSYAMLVIEQEEIDQMELTQLAHWYELEATVTAIYRWLEDGPAEPTDAPIVLPSTQEYTALKEQYGVI